MLFAPSSLLLCIALIYEYSRMISDKKLRMNIRNREMKKNYLSYKKKSVITKEMINALQG